MLNIVIVLQPRILQAGWTGAFSLMDMYLFREPICCYKLQGLHLSEMGWIAEHMNVHELGYVPVSVARILFSERLAQGCTLLGYDIPLFCCCFAGPHSPYELPDDKDQ